MCVIVGINCMYYKLWLELQTGYGPTSLYCCLQPSLAFSFFSSLYLLPTKPISSLTDSSLIA